MLGYLISMFFIFLVLGFIYYLIFKKIFKVGVKTTKKVQSFLNSDDPSTFKNHHQIKKSGRRIY